MAFNMVGMVPLPVHKKRGKKKEKILIYNCMASVCLLHKHWSELRYILAD